MNKILKKTLSIILTVLMIVTMAPLTFAAGDGVALTIDVTDKSDVSIGNGQTYYDEDGYIITGTNKDLIVYVYEEGNFVFHNASFKTFMLIGGDYEATITLEGDNYLGDTENYYGGISFTDQHLIIEGGENDTLNFNGQADAIGTGGRPGTCTVNGGKINAVTETDQNHPTLQSFGGFIMNGGEVTLSNNYCDVVSCPVTLNGGVLNVVSTSTECAAINHQITVEKGALLTVSSASGILSEWDGADIVVADDAEENESLFGKYNAEDEFVPVYDIKSALESKIYAEIKADTHNHSFTNDECACGFVCEHTDREDGLCTVCKRYIYEITHQPTLAEPYVELNNDADALYQWYTATDKVAEVIDGNEIVDKKENTYYEEETGWNGTWYDGRYVEYFDIYLKAGQKLTLIPDAYCLNLAIFSLVEYTTVESQECEGGTELTYIAENDGWYSIFADADSSDNPRLRAYADGYDYTEIENETSARLENVEIGKKYACEVTYGDGKTEMSGVMESDGAPSKISEVTYTPSVDTHNTFTVTVDGRPTMIQFIEEDGGTRTYDRNNSNVTITTYDADGNEVNSLDRTAAYEVWSIYTNLIGPDVKMRAKYVEGTTYKWEKNTYNFTLEFAEPVYDTEIYESYLEPVTKKGPAKIVLVTGADVQGVQFKMPNGTTTTYYADGAQVLADGKLEFTGKVWMNESGENRIEIYVRSQNTWTYYGNIKHTVE